jgi:hypothetical protein
MIFGRGKLLMEYNKSNLEVHMNTALSNALMNLDPLKNSYSNTDLTVEIEILQWILDIVQKMPHNLNYLKELVEKEIDNFKIKYYFTKDIDEIGKLTKSLEILQTCLFLITMELESQPLYSINGIIKNNLT